MPNPAFLFQRLAVIPRRNANIHTYEQKYILKWVCGSNSLALFRNSFLFFFFFGTSLFYTPMGRSVTRRDPAHVNPKIKLCMHIIF